MRVDHGRYGVSITLAALAVETLLVQQAEVFLALM
jgi:hypothetical protein